MSDLRDRLQTAVGDSYRIEKELGGGGMSRVFLADEVALGRKVVIKVLPPEMSAGVSIERFHREIKLAAKLQHPHVVSLLTAGSEDDLLYYVMPYIEGESLRAKLQRSGELPIGETLRILREVVDALAYAHRSGVVHRDIKPDNVLLSEGHAVVTDFGVAKAVTASSGSSSLTSLGVALGTPAYMSPEQAAADPHTDHRADIYAVGALAYEMLCGEPPFTGPTPQSVMAKHVSEAAEPLIRRRPAVSEVLNSVVMRCLEKRAADRWQSAAELMPELDALTTPSGGMTPTGTQPVMAMTTSAAERVVRNAQPLRVIGLFGLASVGALAIVYFLVQLIGLPDWVFYGAIGLLAAGLPIVLLTGHREKQRAFATMTGMSIATPVGLERHFTWRKSLIGGGLAFVGLAVIAGVYMAMRVMGIGPVGTLVASGVLEERDPLVVADFENRTADSTLGPSITEALRIDLGQSPIIKLVETSAIDKVLRRMNREPGAVLDLSLAREIAQREGYKAVLTGEISPLGSGYVLSARLVSAADGETLVPLRETAESDAGIIGAVDRLSARLRERIGESLRTIRASESLERVTTSSVEALKKYTMANQISRLPGGDEQAVRLLEESIALDSTFAMAYRKLAAYLSNIGASNARQNAAASKAFEFRDRLTPVERHLAAAYYYGSVEYDRAKTISAYRDLLELDPENDAALNNLSLILQTTDRFGEAEQLALRAIETGPEWQFYANAVSSEISLDKLDEAHRTIDRFAAAVPGQPRILWLRALLASAEGNLAAADAYVDSLARDKRDSPLWRWWVNRHKALLAQTGGRIGDARHYLEQFMAASEQRGLPGSHVEGATRLAYLDVLFGANNDRGLQLVDAALEKHPLDSIEPADRPYPLLASLYADAGKVDRANELMAEFEAEVPEAVRRGFPFRHQATARIAIAEGRSDDAIAAITKFQDEASGRRVGWFDMAQAYELAGKADSALLMYERAVARPDAFQVFGDAFELPRAYNRLGELYEGRGNSEKATEYYNKFVELWSDADEELQPKVKDVRNRIARLVGER